MAIASRLVEQRSPGSDTSPLINLMAPSTNGESIESQIVAVVTGSLMKLKGTSEYNSLPNLLQYWVTHGVIAGSDAVSKVSSASFLFVFDGIDVVEVAEVSILVSRVSRFEYDVYALAAVRGNLFLFLLLLLLLFLCVVVEQCIWKKRTTSHKRKMIQQPVLFSEENLRLVRCHHQ